MLNNKFELEHEICWEHFHFWDFFYHQYVLFFIEINVVKHKTLNIQGSYISLFSNKTEFMYDF